MDDIEKLLQNAARFAARKGLARFTRFLDPAQIQTASRIARQEGAYLSAWGGYDQAERAICCFYADDEPAREEYPLVCLRSSYPTRFSSLSHRDLLGAFMSLGLTRDCLGDIIIVDDVVYLFTTDATSGFIASGLTSAGRAPLDFVQLDSLPVIPAPKGETFSAVISSMRLDAVLAAAYRLSRSEAAELIRSGQVKVDHIPCERIDLQLIEGTLLSLRGQGRVRLEAINGLTRKQRIGVTFFRYT